MHKLAVLPSSPAAQELMRRLEEASIEAFSTGERSAPDLVIGLPTTVSVWIKEREQLERAAEILAQLQAEATVVRCPNCDYDLQGHDGDAICPECGRPLRARDADVECPNCHEQVPGGFEICWNCGAGIPDA